MRQKDFLLLYIINTRTKLENDVRILQNAVVRRSVDEVDCLELMLAIERLSSFNEFCNAVCGIFHLGAYDNDNNDVDNVEK